MKKPAKVLSPAISLCLLLVTGSGLPVFSQGNASPEIASFLILIETTDVGFKMTCEKGCAWKELTFDVNPYKPQAIDQWGMTSQGEHAKRAADANLANFLFTAIRTKENGVNLEAMEGTAWKKLGFRDPDNYSREYVDAYGTAKPKR